MPDYVVGGAAPAGMDRDHLFGRNWDRYCSAESSAMQAENRALSQEMSSLNGRRATLGETAYHEQRDALLARRDALAARWDRVKSECADHRLDIGGLEGSEPPRPMPPRNEAEAAADERERAATRAEAARIDAEAAAAEARRALEADALQPSPPSEVLMSVLGAGLAAGASMLGGAAGRAAARGAGNIVDDVVDDAAAAVSDDLAAAVAGHADDIVPTPPGNLPTPRFGGQGTHDCVASATAYARREGIDPERIVDSGAGLFRATAGYGDDVPAHYAVRNFDGTITDAAIINNIKQYNNGVMPPDLAQYWAYDTFDQTTYDWLMARYVALTGH